MAQILLLEYRLAEKENNARTTESQLSPQDIFQAIFLALHKNEKL